MKLYERNGEANLFEKINNIEEDRGRWRAIHIRLSRELGDYRPSLRTFFVAQGVAGLFQQEEGSIYFCRDHDIFILFTGRVRPLLGRLACYFASIDPAYHAAGLRSLFGVYDIGRDWPIFSKLCYRKSLGLNGEAQDALVALGTVRVESLMMGLQA